MFALLKTVIDLNGDAESTSLAVSESTDLLKTRALEAILVEDDEADLAWGQGNDGDSGYQRSAVVPIALDEWFFEIEKVEVLS